MEATETTEQPERLLNTREAARILGISPGTLDVWRSRRRYPLPFVKLGHSVRYSVREIQKFIADRVDLSLDPKPPCPSEIKRNGERRKKADPTPKPRNRERRVKTKAKRAAGK